jgi:aminoglycoside 3-N-acetyltransferase
MRIVKDKGLPVSSNNLPQDIYNFLLDNFSGTPEKLSFPAFNYSFGGSRVFDVENDPIQVGSFPAWVEEHSSLSRSYVPFFSVLANEAPDKYVDFHQIIEPFGSTSHFQTLYDEDAIILFFGAEIHTWTFIHFVEAMSGGPVYRYDKNFPGHVVLPSGEKKACDFKMHVRPMGVEFEYDWPLITTDLIDAGIMKSGHASGRYLWMRARQACDFFLQKMEYDPLYLLRPDVKTYFKEVTKNGTRRVQQYDFEGQTETKSSPPLGK